MNESTSPFIHYLNSHDDGLNFKYLTIAEMLWLMYVRNTDFGIVSATLLYRIQTNVVK